MYLASGTFPTHGQLPNTEHRISMVQLKTKGWILRQFFFLIQNFSSSKISPPAKTGVLGSGGVIDNSLFGVWIRWTIILQDMCPICSGGQCRGRTSNRKVNHGLLLAQLYDSLTAISPIVVLEVLHAPSSRIVSFSGDLHGVCRHILGCHEGA